jgi:hypothetical protein
MAAEEKMKQGMSHKEALRAVRLEQGSLEVTKEVVRSAGWEMFVETLWQDLHFATRMLCKSPGFTAITVVTLALGIGANTAMFSVVQGVLLAPLQYFHPDRLVMVWENNLRFPRTWVSYPNYRDWQRGARSLQQMAAFRVAIISNRLWRNRFDGSHEALGKSLTLEGVDYTIVGVTPLGFRLMEDVPEDGADVYTPLGRSDPLILNDRAGHNGICSLARLGPGVTLAQAQAEISTIQNGMDQLYPDANRDLGIYIEPLKQFVVGDAAKMLLLLFQPSSQLRTNNRAIICKIGGHAESRFPRRSRKRRS